MEIGISSELLTLIITLVGSLGATVPILAKFKLKLNQLSVLLIHLDEALADDKISKEESVRIMGMVKVLVGGSK